jgi:hypothetical protein
VRGHEQVRAGGGRLLGRRRPQQPLLQLLLAPLKGLLALV